jgi:hypothetical protein
MYSLRIHCYYYYFQIGDDLTDNGKHNAKIGDVHDFSKKKHSVVYVLPRKLGRYFYFESQLPQSFRIYEIEIYEETQRKFVSFDSYNNDNNNGNIIIKKY